MTGKRASATDPKAMFEYFMTPHIPAIEKMSDGDNLPESIEKEVESLY
jgi:hypothetical protein